MVTKTKAMIISVGGTPAPIIFSLNKSKPEYICFFTSKETKGNIEKDILPKLEFKLRHYDWIVTPNAELLTDCYSELTKKLPDILEKWEVDPREIRVDYTGGTKTMSVALALATIEQSCCYSYVGGHDRSKGGIGVVVDGQEKMWFIENPWDEIAHKEKKDISTLFNKARYASAAEIVEKCITMVSKNQQPFFKAIRELLTGYDLWDRFKHAEARKHLYKSREVLTALGSFKSDLQIIANHLVNNLHFIEALLAKEKPSFYHFCDLLSNAKRRADLEHKFDDAVARLYRAIEVLAQVELKEGYGIDASDVKEDSIPGALREEYLYKYKDKHDSKIKTPLFASYRLLRELGNETANSFFIHYEEKIRPILNIRNSTILAHGFNSVSQETFQKLFVNIMMFSKTKEDDLPTFPSLNL